MHFGAGNRISFGLTAVVLITQWIWPIDFLWSPADFADVYNSFLYLFTYKRVTTWWGFECCFLFQFGISGSYFFGAPFVLLLILFPIIALKYKVVAPGARTYPQVIYARFGRFPHILVCIMALFLNICNFSTLITGYIIH